MRVRVSDLGAKVENNRLYSIGSTSILLEWIEENEVLYRMLLDMGLKNNNNSTYKIDTTNLQRIKNIMEDKVPGYPSGIQAIVLSHCHEDHCGGYPWFYTYCKSTKIPDNGTPRLYMTGMTQKQFTPFQNELYDLFVEPSKGSGFEWGKSIINEISRNYSIKRDYNSPTIIIPNPIDFNISLRFIPSGHIVGSAMIELDTIKHNQSIGKILYTGDTCFRDGGFLVDPINQQIITNHYKAVIMEGTYLRNTCEEYKKLRRPQLREILKEKIIDTIINKGGNLVLLVYGIDRTANIMVALREILDENKLGVSLRNKIFLDTSIGEKITSGYISEFESFVKFELPNEDYSYFRKQLINRYDNGNGASMLQLPDRSTMYESISGTEQRQELVYKYENGGCIVIATSATLEGGTALMEGSYMHPDGWGSDKKNLFLIVGGAIPSTMAKRAITQYQQTHGEYCDIWYQPFEKTEEGCQFLPKVPSQFTSRLEQMNQFSAHANHDELKSFIERVNSNKFLITHIGGNFSPETTQDYVTRFHPGSVILTGDNKVNIELEESKNTITLDIETYNMLRIKSIKDKGYYSNTIACDVIRRMISETNNVNNINNINANASAT